MNKQPRARIVDRTDVETRLQLIQTVSTTSGKHRLSSPALSLVLGFLALQAVTVLAVLALILSPEPANPDVMAELDVSTAIEAAVPASEPPPPPEAAPPQSLTPILPSPPPVRIGSASAALKLRGVELTQGIQVFQEPEYGRCQSDPGHPDYIFCNNSIPMVAGRHTLVRVYVACQEHCPGTETVVQLRLVKEGQEQTQLTRLLPAEMLQRVSPLSLPELRSSLDNSINFEFFPPPAWLKGQVTLEVALLDQATTLPVATFSLTKEFAERKPLRIAYLPIQYQNVRPPEPVGADYWLLRMYPVPAVEYYRLPMPDLVWEGEMSKGEILRKLLYTYWYYAQYPSVGSHLPDQLFGWLPQEFYNGGASDPFWCPDCSGPHSSRVAFGGLRPEQDIGGPRILVHELAHNFGARHAWSPTNREDTGCFRAEGVDIQVDPEWPYIQEPHIQEFGIDLYSDPPVIYPPSYYDMMAYCTQPWISPHTYRKIFDSPFLKPEAEVALSIPELPVTEPADNRGTLLVSGVVYPDGTISQPEIIQLTGDAFTDAASFTPPPPPSPTGDEYCVNVQASDQALLAQHCFSVGFADLETGLPTESSAFLFPLPDIDPAEVGEVTVSKNDQELVTVKPSNHPPEIKLISPPTAGALSGEQQVTWEAVDPDGDPLRYDLLYSPDGGRSWVPLAMHLVEPHYTLSAGQLSSSSEVVIRVVAHDGFHTTSAESAAFALQAPTPNSISLVGPAVVEPGQAFEVAVVAHDIAAPGLFGVQFKLQFDPRLVQVDEIVGDTALELVVDRTIQNDTGQLSFVASRQGRAENLTGELTIATLKLTAKSQPGQLALNLNEVTGGALGGVPLSLSTAPGFSLQIKAAE